MNLTQSQNFPNWILRFRGLKPYRITLRHVAAYLAMSLNRASPSPLLEAHTQDMFSDLGFDSWCVRNSALRNFQPGLTVFLQALNFPVLHSLRKIFFNRLEFPSNPLQVQVKSQLFICNKMFHVGKIIRFDKFRDLFSESIISPQVHFEVDRRKTYLNLLLRALFMGS